MEDHVATITLNQPDTRNALSNELLTDLIAALETARDDDEARVVVLTSSHETTFSSGANLAGLRPTCRWSIAISARPSSRSSSG